MYGMETFLKLRLKIIECVRESEQNDEKTDIGNMDEENVYIGPPAGRMDWPNYHLKLCPRPCTDCSLINISVVTACSNCTQCCVPHVCMPPYCIIM